MKRVSATILTALASLAALAPLTGCVVDPPGPETDTDDGAATTGIVLDDDDDASSTTQDPDPEPDGSASDTTPAKPDIDPCSLCGCVDEVPPPLPPSIVLVLDKSGSMFTRKWDHDGDDLDQDGESDANPGEPATPKVTRWFSLHRVVTQIAEDFGAQLNLGAQLFPAIEAVGSDPVQACLVESSPEVAVAADNAAELLMTIPAAGTMNLAGGTPAERGVASAADHLSSLDAAAFPGQKYMMLITDGGANCSAEAAQDDFDEVQLADPMLASTVEEALLGWKGGDSIETMVVGIDIQDAYDGDLKANPLELLNDVADAGGHGLEGDEHFYNATDEDQLLDALQQLVGEISCTIPLGEGGQPYMTTLHVDIDGDEQPELTPEACAQGETGWAYADDLDPHLSITLCGGACEAYKQGQSFDGTFECTIPG